jgi:hypothetical protein
VLLVKVVCKQSIALGSEEGSILGVDCGACSTEVERLV